MGTNDVGNTVGNDVAFVGDSVAFVGESVASLGYSVAFVGESVALVGDNVAFVGDDVDDADDGSAVAVQSLQAGRQAIFMNAMKVALKQRPDLAHSAQSTYLSKHSGRGGDGSGKHSPHVKAQLSAKACPERSSRLQAPTSRKAAQFGIRSVQPFKLTGVGVVGGTVHRPHVKAQLLANASCTVQAPASRRAGQFGSRSLQPRNAGTSVGRAAKVGTSVGRTKRPPRHQPHVCGHSMAIKSCCKTPLQCPSEFRKSQFEPGLSVHALLGAVVVSGRPLHLRQLQGQADETKSDIFPAHSPSDAHSTQRKWRSVQAVFESQVPHDAGHRSAMSSCSWSQLPSETQAGHSSRLSAQLDVGGYVSGKGLAFGAGVFTNLSDGVGVPHTLQLPAQLWLINALLTEFAD